jgi:hypothetical protein
MVKRTANAKPVAVKQPLNRLQNHRPANGETYRQCQPVAVKQTIKPGAKPTAGHGKTTY